MIVNDGQYNYHCVVQHLYSGTVPENNLKYTVIKGHAHCRVASETTPSGEKLIRQNLTIFTYGGMSQFVDAEISEGDKIMVVGKIVTTTKCKGSYFYQVQCIQAEEIYKNDWYKYYGKEKKKA